MFILFFVAAIAAGCATVREPRVAALEPLDGTTAPAPAASATEAAVIALSLIGTPYSAGGAAPDTGFDCSGLVAYVFERAAQVQLPRNTFDLAQVAAAIDAAALRPGDLVFYNTQRRAFSHVGIYLGEARFVHAPSSGGAVRVEDMRLGYWTQRFDGARRLSF
jgi:cell wall-associated NlpC family hydrolase